VAAAQAADSEVLMSDDKQDPTLADMTNRLVASAGDRLAAVILYGPAAHGDIYKDKGTSNLLIVVRDLELGTLARLSEPVNRWVKKGHPVPRIFSKELLEAAADVFPIEILDISSHHVILHGESPFGNVDVQPDHLRLQCERELREKMLRLREAYVEAAGHDKELRRLLLHSYPAFVLIFRGCLRFMGQAVPVHNLEVVRALCQTFGLPPDPLARVEAMEHGENPGNNHTLFVQYYDLLTQIVKRVDELVTKGDKTS